MSGQRRPSLPTTVVGLGWGEVAAARLHRDWLARVLEARPDSLLLVDQDGEVVRLVTPALGNGPFHVVVPEDAAPLWMGLPNGQYVWRVRRALWLGDHLTVELPDSEPWESALSWAGEALALPPDALARHLALLGDWLLARAPEGTLATLLPDLLNDADVVENAARRADLSVQPRLFRWRAARVLSSLIPALVAGNMAEAEETIHSLAGLGPGDPPAGDSFMVGLMAGLRLWPAFLEQGSGLRGETLIRRLARSMTERTTILARATLMAAVEGRWEQEWHRLHGALTASGPYPDARRDELYAVAAGWMAQDENHASAALAGLLLPFLWHQRFFTE